MAQRRFKGAILAPWHKRVAVFAIDWQIFWLVYSVYVVAIYVISLFTVAGSDAASGSAVASSVLAIASGVLGLTILFGGIVLSIAWLIWNNYILRGRTGRNYGSRVLYLRLVSETDGRPVGGFDAFLRALLHILDLLPLGIGFLFPIWTKKKQTFADMLMHTVVVVEQRSLPPEATSFRKPRPQDMPPQGMYAPYPVPPPAWSQPAEDPLNRYGV